MARAVKNLAKLGLALKSRHSELSWRERGIELSGRIPPSVARLLRNPPKVLAASSVSPPEVTTQVFLLPHLANRFLTGSPLSPEGLSSLLALTLTTS
jgi:hypothetical protein